MKRSIVPRSQRTMKSTVSPSIVVVVAMSAGRGAPGVYVAHAPPVVRYIHLTWVGNAHDGSVPGVVRSAAASRSACVHLNTFCHGPENIAGSALSAWLTSLSSARVGLAWPHGCRHRARPERETGDDALELVIAFGILRERRRDVRAVQRHANGGERRRGWDDDLDPCVPARDVLRRARDDAHVERAVQPGRRADGGCGR